jgi:hypothetical protein
MTLIFVNDEKMTIKSLCAMINKAPRMDVFEMAEVDLDGTKGDIIVLSKALCEHPSLADFHIYNVTLTDGSLSLDQVMSMVQVSVPDLKHCKLKKVPLSSPTLAGAGYCTSLERPMSGHFCLEEIHLASVSLIDSSLSLDRAIFMVLDLVPDLWDVELEEVPVSSSELAAAGYCTSLETSIVHKSGLTDKDVIELSEAVAQSPSVQSIDIPGIDLSDVRCDAFATNKSSSIQTIRLESNGKISGERRTRVEATLGERAGGKAHAA